MRSAKLRRIPAKIRSRAARLVPESARRWLAAQRARFSVWPPVGWVRFGALRRVQPVNREFGIGRGLPICRWYIERFLAAHADDIAGRVLEIGDPAYTRRFGGDRVTQSDVLHIAEGSPHATLVGDLTRGDDLPAEAFDCVILTQTLNVIYDVHAAVRTVYRLLKPGGVALVSVPGISQISRYDMDRWGEYWRFTTASARRLFEECWPPAGVEVQAHGNVLDAAAYLYGLASDDLRRGELAFHDPDYELLITVRAVKPQTAAGAPPHNPDRDAP
ncbi:MAG: class I SAM-dependent methyltransferase [Anaerolineae bacterium]|nr:class I SAM-dependent methyltransferase [Anaerolineae bacterium]